MRRDGRPRPSLAARLRLSNAGLVAAGLPRAVEFDPALRKFEFLVARLLLELGGGHPLLSLDCLVELPRLGDGGERVAVVGPRLAQFASLSGGLYRFFPSRNVRSALVGIS
jgi:hypothetical protein